MRQTPAALTPRSTRYIARVLVFLVAFLWVRQASAAGDGNISLGLVELLREFGFPIFVSVWFMWRLEKRLDHFTELIEKLITLVTVQGKIIEDLPAGPPGPQGPAGPPGPPSLSTPTGGPMSPLSGGGAR